MALGAKSCDAARELAGKIDADRDRARAEIGVGRIDQPLARLQRRKLLAVEPRVAAPEADLRQPRAAPHQDRKRARADFQKQRTLVARRQRVERGDPVAHHAREHVEPAGRAFRIGRRGKIGRQRQRFLELHEINAARFKYRAGVRKLDLVQGETHQPLVDAGARRRQKARADAPGARAEPQIEARRLHLIGADGQRPSDRAGFRRAPGSPAPAGYRRRLSSPARPVQLPCAATYCARCLTPSAARE